MNETNVGLPVLPEGWIWTTVSSIGLVASGQTPKGINDFDSKGKIPFYKISDMNKLGNEKFMRDTAIALDDAEIERLGIHVREQGTVIFPKRGGAIATNKKRILSYPSAYDLNIMGVSPYIVPTDFFYHWLLSIDLATLSDGSNVPQLNHKHIDPLPFPLPPFSEQHRIVAKIEELFTKLDAGKEELLQAKARLKRYRQSVLKAAMDGKLTEDWRKTHEGEIEPASVLLYRILKERRKKWEAEQLEQMKAKGKMPKDDKWKNKYKEPLGPDTSKLPELPEGWVWATVGQVTDLVTKGASPKWQGFSYVDKGIFFLRSQNVVWGDINLSDIACLPKAFNQKQKKSILKKGDVLLNLVGASIGRAAIASGELDGANMNQAVALIRLVKNGLDNKLLMNYLLSPDTQSIIHGKKVDVARANLSLTDVSSLAVTLPPLPEQHRIISEVERRLSVADAVEATVDAELKRSDTLRQSILKQAFSGKLVPQNPNDEPAEKLLERITKEKSKRESEQKTKRKTKKQLALFEH